MKNKSILSRLSNRMTIWNKVNESAKSFEYIEYDENHNKIYSCRGTEKECGKEVYDDDDNFLYTVVPDEEIEGEYCGYDIRGDIVYTRFPSGLEIWSEYDENHNVIHSRHINGDEWWYEYDESGKQLRRNNK